MGTTSQKLTYLNDTKTKIRDGINAIGGSLDSDDTFRSYVDELESLYDEMPKVSDTGTNITLDNTRVGKMELTYKGNTQQDSEPTPDSPVDVNVVSGDNTIEICGKNLFDGELVQGGITYQTGADETANDRVRTKNYIRVMPNTTYTLKRYNVNNKQLGLRYYDKNKNYIGYLSATTNEVITFTTRQDGQDIYYVRWIDLENNLNAKYQLELGNEATTYEAYTGQSQLISLGDIELCKIGDYQDFIYKEAGKWYIEKQVGKVVIDGTTGTFSNPSTNRYNIDNLITDYRKVTGNGDNLSNYYQGYTQTSNNNQFNTLVANENYGFNLSSSSSTIRFKNTDISSTDDFKTWLGTHPTSVYYVLATPTYTEITDTTLLGQLEALKLSYDGQTNVSQSNNDLPFILDVSSLKEWE